MISVMLAGCDFDGDGYVWKADPNIHYSDAKMRARLKQELEKAEIPYKTYKADGKNEFISWKPKYDERVQSILKKIEGVKPRLGHNVGGEPGTMEDTKSRFREAGIQFETSMYQGMEFVSWLPEDHELATKVWMNTSTPVSEILAESNKRLWFQPPQ